LNKAQETMEWGKNSPTFFCTAKMNQHIF